MGEAEGLLHRNTAYFIGRGPAPASLQGQDEPRHGGGGRRRPWRARSVVQADFTCFTNSPASPKLYRDTTSFHQSRSRPCIAAGAGRTPSRRRREEETVTGAFGYFTVGKFLGTADSGPTRCRGLDAQARGGRRVKIPDCLSANRRRNQGAHCPGDAPRNHVPALKPQVLRQLFNILNHSFAFHRFAFHLLPLCFVALFLRLMLRCNNNRAARVRWEYPIRPKDFC